MLYDKDIEAYYCVLNEKKKRKENRLDVLRRIVEDYWKYVRK